MATNVSVTKEELKQIKTLLVKKGRREKGLFSAEGVRLLEEAARHRFWPTKVYYAPFLLSARGQKLLHRFQMRQIPAANVPAANFRSVCDSKSPQGILGVFTVPSCSLSELYRPRHRRLLMCEDVSDPGNLGTLARSALAFDFNLLLLVGSCADPFSPKVVRSSAGAVFALGIARLTVPEMQAFIRKERIRLLAADVKGQPSANVIKNRFKSRRTMLAVGGEARGLTPSLLAAADARVRIVHGKLVESLNVAIAASIIMKQIFDLNQG